MPDHRDQRPQHYLEWANGDQEAAAFLHLMGRAVRLADDIVDGDAPNAADAMAELLHLAFIEIPNGPFYRRHASSLQPVIANVIQMWNASEEWRGSENRKTRMFAFVLREQSEQIAYTVALLTGGYAHARAVVRDTHRVCDAVDPETFEEWEAE